LWEKWVAQHVVANAPECKRAIDRLRHPFDGDFDTQKRCNDTLSTAIGTRFAAGRHLQICKMPDGRGLPPSLL
jgi:hypothetical protein